MVQSRMADIKLTLVVACALVDADKRVLIARAFVADDWLPQVRLAHLPDASPPSSEDH